MRIAFIVTEFPNVSETFILNQITSLLESGNEVEIFSCFKPVRQKEKKVHPDVQKYNLQEHTHYFSSIPNNRMLRILKASFLVITNVFKAPVMVFKSLNIFRFKNLRLIYSLVPFLNFTDKTKKFDIIHCHFGPNGIWGLNLKFLGLKGKLLTSFHGYDVNSYPQEQGIGIYNDLFKYGDGFTANTNFTKIQAVKLGCPENKIHIVHEGLKSANFKYLPRKLKPGENINLLTLGRLVEKKGHKYTLKALKEILMENRNIMYTIAGDGPLREELEKLTDELGIKDNVIFLGKVDQSEAVKLYNQAHIFILTSVTAANSDREGQALVLQEAQACGIPVIATLHNGIPEGVLDGESGFLVPERNVDILVEKLKTLIENPQIWGTMGKCGQEFVQKKFDADILNLQLIKVYKKI
ncbi:MAG: glycosyltransferase [Candidatus Omnitrophota bacterium]